MEKSSPPIPDSVWNTLASMSGHGCSLEGGLWPLMLAAPCLSDLIPDLLAAGADPLATDENGDDLP
jgi:hypothetical protein